MRFIVFVSLMSICSCSVFKNWHFPYMMEVQQGNYITKEQYSQLQVGLTKNEVVDTLGYPLVEYVFKKNQWDFIYQNYRNNKLTKSYTITIIFDQNDKIEKIYRSGDGLFFD